MNTYLSCLNLYLFLICVALSLRLSPICVLHYDEKGNTLFCNEVELAIDRQALATLPSHLKREVIQLIFYDRDFETLAGWIPLVRDKDARLRPRMASPQWIHMIMNPSIFIICSSPLPPIIIDWYVAWKKYYFIGISFYSISILKIVTKEQQIINLALICIS